MTGGGADLVSPPLCSYFPDLTLSESELDDEDVEEEVWEEDDEEEDEEDDDGALRLVPVAAVGSMLSFALVNFSGPVPDLNPDSSNDGSSSESDEDEDDEEQE